eukprot:6184409-Pleurochrysis_carterae.AAC.5
MELGHLVRRQSPDARVRVRLTATHQLVEGGDVKKDRTECRTTSMPLQCRKLGQMVAAANTRRPHPEPMSKNRWPSGARP